MKKATIQHTKTSKNGFGVHVQTYIEGADQSGMLVEITTGKKSTGGISTSLCVGVYEKVGDVTIFRRDPLKYRNLCFSNITKPKEDDVLTQHYNCVNAYIEKQNKKTESNQLTLKITD